MREYFFTKFCSFVQHVNVHECDVLRYNVQQEDSALYAMFDSDVKNLTLNSLNVYLPIIENIETK